MMMASRLPATLLSVAALLVASTSAAIAAVPTVSAVPGTTNSNATVDRNARFQNCFGYPYDYGYGSRPYYPHYKRDGKSKDSVSWFGSCIIAPKVLIISLFEPEADVWYNIPQFDLLELNITVAGLSPLFPQVHCTFDAEVCQVTLGEAEINAATSITALWRSPYFDFRRTYFFTAGIAGVNPEIATTASVTFARYAVSVALQYEIDYRELSTNFTTGYIPQGSKVPSQYPQTLYGTEVFELNDALRRIVAGFASTAVLNDSATAIAYRANYARSPLYTAGASPPRVVLCDTATSDVFFSGVLLSDAFANYTRLVTNGTGIYCTTAQEDTAIHESLLRAALARKADFSRVITMRTASDFDREYPGQNATTNLLYADPGGFEPSLQNIYLAGIRVVEGIINAWDEVFFFGIPPTNYIGDIFGTLGGIPDFGPGPIAAIKAKQGVPQAGGLNGPAAQKKKRALAAARSMVKGSFA